MADYQIISTKCPIINTALGHGNSSRDLEVLVRLKDVEPHDVICPEYTPEKGCAKRKEGCIYKMGWQPLK